MKKIFTIFVCMSCMAATGVFAQLTTELHWTFVPNLLTTVIPTGMYADKTMRNSQTNEKETNTDSTYLDRVWLYGTMTGNPGSFVAPGDLSLFTPMLSPGAASGINLMNNNYDARFRLLYTRGIINALVGFDLHRGLQDIVSPPGTYNMRPLIQQLWDYIRLDEFQIGLNDEMFEFWIGNQEASNKTVDPYPDFTEWTGNLNVDGFGVNVATSSNQFFIFDTMKNHFRYQTRAGAITTYNELFNVVGRIKLLQDLVGLPITVDVAMDTRAITNSTTNSTQPSQLRFGGGFGIGGEDIAGLLNFDLMYMVRGGDGDLRENWNENTNSGPVQPDGVGNTNHYINLALGFPGLVPDLGISAAYTLMFAVYEDERAPPNDSVTPVITRKGPVFNGIDIRARYTGIENLRLTFHTNISFAKADEPGLYDNNGTMTRKDHSVSIYGVGDLPAYRSQNWFAMYNALAARYRIDGRFAAGLELAHRMGIITEKNSLETRGGALDNWGKSERVRNILQVSPHVIFNFGQNTTLQSGVILWIENNKTTFSDYIVPTFYGPSEWEGGAIGIGVPIMLKMVW